MPIKHIALVQFKPGTAEETITALFQELERLPSVIPGILDLSWGANNSPEGLAGPFTHGFVMTFPDAAARDRYLPHPAHEAAKLKILPHVANVVIFDYEV